MPKFIEVAGQLVRLDSITRLAEQTVLYAPDARGYFAHLTDGGMLTLSEVEYQEVKRALMPAKRKRKETAGV